MTTSFPGLFPFELGRKSPGNEVGLMSLMKRSASERIKNGYFNLEKLSRSFRLTWPGISTLERLWNGFVSDA